MNITAFTREGQISWKVFTAVTIGVVSVFGPFIYLVVHPMGKFNKAHGTLWQKISAVTSRCWTAVGALGIFWLVILGVIIWGVSIGLIIITVRVGLDSTLSKFTLFLACFSFLSPLPGNPGNAVLSAIFAMGAGIAWVSQYRHCGPQGGYQSCTLVHTEMTLVWTGILLAVRVVTDVLEFGLHILEAVLQRDDDLI